MTRAQARRIALAAQGLESRRSGGRVTMRQIQAVVNRLGVIQLDSVNVLARAHTMPFFSRLGPYDAALLERATGRQPRRLVEYWAHEASLMPPATRGLLAWRMERAAREAWRPLRAIAREEPLLVEKVFEEVAARGPITAAEMERALEHDVAHMQGNWGWNWSQVKAALEFLFWAGRITSAGRTTQFERRYDLPERVLPPPGIDASESRAAAGDDPAGAAGGVTASAASAPSAASFARDTPAEEEAIRELVRIAARAHGIGTERCLRDYFRLGAPEGRRAIADLVEAGELIPVEVVEESGRAAGRPAAGRPAAGRPDHVRAFLHSEARRPRRVSGRALISPFDPLAWERDRLEWLFGFRYKLEIYTPAAKRVHGYYVLPFLLGERLVARVDLKAERPASRLIVQAAYAEATAPAETASELAAELCLMADWLRLEWIEVSDRGDLASALRRALPAR